MTTTNNQQQQPTALNQLTENDIRRIFREELKAVKTTGFCNPYRQWIHVEKKEIEGQSYFWVYFDEQKVMQGIKNNVLIGHIVGIGVWKNPDSEGNLNEYLMVDVDTYQGDYKLKSGLRTTFSKSLLYSLMQHEKEHFQHLFKLTVKQGTGKDGVVSHKTKNVVLPNLICPDVGFIHPTGSYPHTEDQLKACYLNVIGKIPQVKYKDPVENT